MLTRGKRQLLLFVVLIGAMILLTGNGPSPRIGAQDTPAQILFVSDRDGDPEIFVMDPTGQNTNQLTNNQAIDAAPAWSPDRSRIAFVSDRDGDPEIYIMNADGSNPQRLTNSPGADGDPAWSPDGGRIAFVSGAAGDPEIYVVNADGSNPQRLTDSPGLEASPSWSPDGTRIAFVSERDGNAEIYVMNTDGSALAAVGANPARDIDPAWAPDGSRLAYASDRDGNLEIYVMNADGSNPQRLTDQSAADTAPAWSPDGAQIVFVSERDGNQEVYTMQADGGYQRFITADPAQDSAPDWGPTASGAAPPADGSAGSGTVSGEEAVTANVLSDEDLTLTLADGAGLWVRDGGLPDGSAVTFQRVGEATALAPAPPWTSLGLAYEMVAAGYTGDLVATVTVPYQNGGQAATTLTLAYFEDNTWVALPTLVDPAAGTLSATVHHPGFFAVMARDLGNDVPYVDLLTSPAAYTGVAPDLAVSALQIEDLAVDIYVSDPEMRPVDVSVTYGLQTTDAWDQAQRDALQGQLRTLAEDAIAGSDTPLGLTGAAIQLGTPPPSSDDMVVIPAWATPFEVEPGHYRSALPLKDLGIDGPLAAVRVYVRAGDDVSAFLFTRTVPITGETLPQPAQLIDPGAIPHTYCPSQPAFSWSWSGRPEAVANYRLFVSRGSDNWGNPTSVEFDGTDASTTSWQPSQPLPAGTYTWGLIAAGETESPDTDDPRSARSGTFRFTVDPTLTGSTCQVRSPLRFAVDAICTASAGQGCITTQVVDTSGQPVAGAQVILYPLDGSGTPQDGDLLIGRTGAGGGASLPVAPGQEYGIWVGGADGFSAWSGTACPVSGEAGSDQQLTISLIPGIDQTLDCTTTPAQRDGAGGPAEATPTTPAPDAPTLTPTPAAQADAIVDTDTLNVRDRPGLATTVIEKLDQGTELAIVARVPDGTWVLVIMPDGSEGWVFTDLLRLNINLDSVDVRNVAIINPTAAPTSPPGPDWTINFFADRYSISSGECVTITWSVEGIQEVYFEGGGVIGNDSRVVCPTSTTTYELRVLLRDGNTEYRYLTINVGPPY